MTKVSIFNQEYEYKEGAWTGGDPVIADTLNLLAGIDEIDPTGYTPNVPAHLAGLAHDRLGAKIIEVDELQSEPGVVY
jgi:hypothetical protein